MESTRTSVMYQVRILYPNKDWSYSGSHSRFERVFNSCFNMTLDQITVLVMKIWWMWEEDLYIILNAIHLLWTLVYLKRYPTYDQLKCDIGNDQKTLKKWILYTVDILAEIGMVCIVHKIKHLNSHSFRFHSRTDLRVEPLDKIYLGHYMGQNFLSMSIILLIRVCTPINSMQHALGMML